MTKYPKIICFFLLLFTFCLLFSNFAYGKAIELYFFWGSGCPHCAKMAQVLQEIKTQYPELNSPHSFEVWYNPNNRRLLNAMAAGYNFEPTSVPVIFIGEKVIEGDSQASINQLKEAVKQCSVLDCISPIDKIKTSKNKIELNWGNIGIFAGVVIFIFLIVSLLRKNK